MSQTSIALSLAIVLLATILGGCQAEEREPIRPDPNLPPLPASFSATDPIDVWLGPTHLRIPWNMIGSSDRYNSLQRTRRFREIALLIRWPSLEGSTAVPGPNPSRGLFVELRSYVPPIGLPTEQDEAWLRERVRTLDGPYENLEFGLREWRLKSNGAAVAFAYLEEGQFRPDGGIHYVGCPWMRRARSEDLMPCYSGGALNSSLRYQYRFNKSEIGEWRAMEDAVRQLLESFVVTEEQR